MGASKLVIVESPAKASTIEGYLGPDFHVTASIGHIRDLPQPKDLPTEMKKGPFGRFAVDVDGGFKPYYTVTADKKKKVTELKRLLKEADELYLATDEDREGEAIAWHLLEVLKPKVPVKRMVFHEITREAIERALHATRDVDTSLVDAQETRRILDRLYGYEVSPLLWRKIRPSLSAGRVQSVATRLVVDRERDRIAHIEAEYWGIDTVIVSRGESFAARVTHIDSHSVATGSDFTERGELTDKAGRAGTVHLTREDAQRLADLLSASASSAVESVTQKPYRRRPAAPFTTSTLQQEASRKLHWNASSTMRTAQSLYESGYITYMRTDSTALSAQAITAARQQAQELYGVSAVAAEPRVYGKVAKGAQEAHEAIRPAGDYFRTPEQVAGQLSNQQLALYDLIWKRTLASQMADAVGYTAKIRVLTGVSDAQGRHDVISSASGTVITSPGFRLAYQEGHDQGRYDAEKQALEAEKVLPDVSEGDRVDVAQANAEEHRTQPPGRYTEATLVKMMEELGIGRPSTYAATIQTIGDRGYVIHRGQYLIPTWLAFSVTRLLEENLANLVDYDFTASMEADLDRIAAGQEDGRVFLSQFYLGADGKGDADGLRFQVESLGDDVDARAVNSIEVAEGVVLRVGRYGPYLEKADGTRANVPETLAPDEVDEEKISELFRLAADDGRELGVDPRTGHVLVAKNGRFGPYVTEILPEPAQVSDTEGTPKKKKSTEKPRTASLFSSMSLSTVTLDDALKLLSLPREVGVDPADGEMITAHNGPYGPYLKKGKDSRTLSAEDLLLTITVQEASQIYAQPKTRGRGTAKPPLREFGEDPVSGKKVVVKDGRFGPYVTDGVTNVTVPRSETVEDLTQARAFELLADKRAKGPAPRRSARQTKTGTKKTAAKKTTKTTSRRRSPSA
ncbi:MULTISPECIES: type I DNA topoisomerase [unclassified Schaalia]|uniref:type I DNA topoisomerase n=1 Tax=unclassified Schaalia TaxID=2691889 RepID=UPI001E3C95D1|nr:MULTISPECIES: type I DNA topoisomerase [unclassified Schaalia]MCD4548897.1 type I DNA topoisomerase [Schaalia sp. lx-260]MCD4557513.1 type I DNA topoisomerase [Schaalia sp. lx-100]